MLQYILYIVSFLSLFYMIVHFCSGIALSCVPHPPPRAIQPPQTMQLTIQSSPPNISCNTSLSYDAPHFPMPCKIAMIPLVPCII